MRRTLVVPQDMINKLNYAASDANTLMLWSSIGVSNTDEMVERAVEELNKRNSKLLIDGTRTEQPEQIKKRLGNSGNVSKFAGYFENENGIVDALFFYIEPTVNSANDFLSRYVMPVVLGMYKKYEHGAKDMHINYMPIYIVSFCSTSRVTNNSVKKNIVLAETMGFLYIDVFDNPYHDVINKIDANGSPITSISTLENLDDFLKGSGQNEYFDIDFNSKTLTIKSNILDNSSNPSAELYRYALRVIPAVYLASTRNFSISISGLSSHSNDSVTLLYKFLNKF